MRKLWCVIKREYVTRVLTKGFIISTIAIPALLIGLIVFQWVVTEKQPDYAQSIAIVDEAGGLGALIQSSLTQEKLPDGRPAFRVTQVLERPASVDKIRAELTARTRAGELSGYLWVPRDVALGKAPRLVVRNPGAFTTLDPLNHAVSQAILTELLETQGIQTQDLARLVHGADIRLIRLTASGESEAKGQMYGIAIAMAVILYSSLLMYGISTMRSVLEEKTSRIMEILVSSIQPFHFLAGKILGVAAVGLTQFLIWAISAGLLGAYGLAATPSPGPGAAGFGGIQLSTSLLVYVVVYFMGGYFLFASMYAAIGAMVSTEQDAQQIQMPITLLLAGSFFLFSVIMRDPNSPISITLSMIPFFSPILMMMRIALQTPPFWQIGLSLLLLALSTLGVTYVSARIYRVGILMYGKRPSLFEVLRWLRYS